MIPTPPFASGSVQGYDFSVGKFNRFVFVGRPMMAYINGGVPPYTWSITGAAFNLANASTHSQFNRIVTNSNTVVGESFEEVTVIDATGREVSFTISCCATYLCCEQQTIVFSVDDVEQMPVSNSVINIYGGCPPFRWISLDSRASFMTEWTEVRQNILMYVDLSDVKGINYQVTDHCGTVVTGFVFEQYPSYTFYFWGDNQWGQSLVGAGNLEGTGYNQLRPYRIPDDPLNPFTHFWCGSSTGFARKKDNTYICAGYGGYGGLGIGGNDWEINAVPMTPPLPDVCIVEILARPNYSNLALLEGGLLYSTGRNNLGQLGVGDKVDRNTWTHVPGSWKRVFSSSHGTVAGVTVGGALYMWGHTRGHHQIAGYTSDLVSPTLIPDITDPILVATGYDYGTVIVTSAGKFYASGVGAYTGLGANNYSGVFIEYVPPFFGLKDVGYGFTHCMAIANDGTLWTFGVDTYGQLGLGPSPGNQATFVQVGTDSDWEEIVDIGIHVNFIRKTNGDIYCWGYNIWAQMGINSSVADVIDVPTIWSLQYDEPIFGYRCYVAKVPK